MEILWHGKTCFTLKGNSATVVMDPYEASILSQSKADLVTLSRSKEDTANVLEKSGAWKVFDWPGEYEVKEVFFLGMENKDDKDSLMFHVSIDGFRICHLGHLKEKLSEETVEALDDVDILLIPIGGGDAINHKIAHEVVEQIDPRIVIPMHYKMAGLDEDLEGIEPFLKEVGSHHEPQASLKLKSRSDLPEETTMFVVLEPQA